LAKKHRNEKPERVPTRHQLSKWEKQRRISRIITICSIAFFVIVIGLIGYGYYSEQVLPYQKTVVKVNDKAFTMDYYIKMLDIFTKGQSSDTLQYYQDAIASAIQQGEIIREKAGDLGITVSDDEVNKEMDRVKMPRNEAAFDATKSSLISAKIIEKVCLPKQPAGVEQVEVQAMLLETKNMANERRSRLMLGDNFSTMAGMLSLDSVTQSKKGYLGWIAKGYEDYSLDTLKDSALKEAVFKLEKGAISEPIYENNIERPYGYWVLEALETDDTKGIHARGIMVGEKEQGDEVKKKLSEGADFGDLAKQYSQHESKDSGGDLGWVVPGMDKGNLGRILSSIAPNTVSEVIKDDSLKTRGGYWIVQVLNKEANRPLDKSIQQALATNCLSEWIDGQMKEAKIDLTLDQQQKDWAVQKILKTRSK
jgi:parvulin-like peptidyl-prolyl isomerase